MAEHVRTMLVIGSTFADALAFLGCDIAEGEAAARAFVAGMPGSLRDLPRRDERASAAVPDELWPPGEPFTAWFRGIDDGITNENGSAPYDAVIVTAAAAADINARATADTVLTKTFRDDGWMWIEGMGVAGTTPRAEKGERRVLLVDGKLVPFTAGERVTVVTRYMGDDPGPPRRVLR